MMEASKIGKLDDLTHVGDLNLPALWCVHG